MVELLRSGLDMFLCSQAWGSLTKLGKKDEPLIVGTGNAGFMDHKDIWQNSQDQEEIHKNNSETVLKSALVEEHFPVLPQAHSSQTSCGFLGYHSLFLWSFLHSKLSGILF